MNPHDSTQNPHASSAQASPLQRAATVAALLTGGIAVFMMLACTGVCNSGDEEGGEGGEGSRREGKATGEGEEEGTGDVMAAIESETASDPIQMSLLPKPVQTLVKCLEVSTAQELAAISPQQAKGCLESNFGAAKGPGRVCQSQPEEVYSSDVLDPCEFHVSQMTRSMPVSKPREGLGRLQVIFKDDRFRGILLQSTRPTINSSATCGTQDRFKALEGTFIDESVSLGERRYQRAGLDFQLVRQQPGGHYPVVRDTLVVTLTGKNDMPHLSAGWERTSIEDLPNSGRMSRDMRAALEEVGEAMGCKRYHGSLLNLLGEPLDKVRKDCAAFGPGRNWVQWPVSESRIADSGNRLQLTSLGADGRIVEVFMRGEASGGQFLKEMRKEMGASTGYQCTAHAWRVNDYVIRVRPAGRFVNIAFTRLEDHDALSMVVPGATIGPSWR